MGIDWADVGDRLWITPSHAMVVVLSTAGIYLVFLVLVRLFGARVLSGMGTFDVVVAITIGAVAGRLILGDPPSLTAGVIGLACLFVLEALLGEARRTTRGNRIVNAGAVVVMAGEEILTENLRAAHVTNAELRAALRQAGVRGRDEVACAVFESTGKISVLPRGRPINPRLLVGVRDADRIPEELVGE